LWLNLERRLDKRHGKMGVAGLQLKGHHFPEGDDYKKGRQLFQEK